MDATAEDGTMNTPRIVASKPWYSSGLSTVGASDLGGGSVLFQTSWSADSNYSTNPAMQPVLFWKAPYTGDVKVKGPIGHYHGVGATMDGIRLTIVRWDTSAAGSDLSFSTGAGNGIEEWQDSVNTSDGKRTVEWDSNVTDADAAINAGEAYHISETISVNAGDMLEFMVNPLTTSNYDSLETDLSIYYLETDREETDGYKHHISLKEHVSRAETGQAVMDADTGNYSLKRMQLETGHHVPRTPKIRITSLTDNTNGTSSPNGSITAIIDSGGDYINDADETAAGTYKKYQLALYRVDYAATDPNESYTDSPDMGPSGFLATGESRTWNNLRGGGWKVVCRMGLHDDTGEGFDGDGFNNLVISTSRIMQLSDA